MPTAARRDTAARSQYLTVPEAAEILRVHPHLIYRQITAGTFPHVRIGRHIRIRRVDLDAYATPDERVG